MEHEKYVVENRGYQKVLDKVYAGTVSPVEKYINDKAIIIHYCHDCRVSFHAKPLWLLKKANQEHICNVDIPLTESSKLRKLSEDEKITMLRMAEQGITMTKIAKTFGISREVAIHYLKKMKRPSN